MWGAVLRKLLNSVHPVHSCGRGRSQTFQSLVTCCPWQKVTGYVNFVMTWPEIVWVTSSDQNPVPSICPWRWTKPPSLTQCKPLSAAQVTFHLTLLQFSSGWRSAEEILFPWGKVWLSLASPPKEREWRKKYNPHFPILFYIFSFLEEKTGTGNQP